MRSRILSLCLLLLMVTVTARSEEPPLTLLAPQGQGQAVSQAGGSAQAPAELHDIYGPVLIPKTVPYGLLAGAAVVLTALALLFYLLYRKRKKPLPPVVPPWEKALGEIRALKKHLNPGESLLYLDGISRILRTYIESRFEVRSTSRTTGEFLSGLEFRTDIPELKNYREELRNCLQKADMAKFAHHGAPRSELETIEQSVVSFVGKTTPVEGNAGGRS
jgi:hypothetical protein